MNNELVKAEVVPDTFLVARTPAEMQKSQAALLSWMENKLLTERKEKHELDAIVKHAKERKWKTSGLTAKAQKQGDRVAFYEKAVEAIRAGYTLIPDFPIDVFAVRVTRDWTLAADQESKYRRLTASDLPAEKSDNATLGEGEFKSTMQKAASRIRTEKQKDGSMETIYTVEALALKDPVFPLRMAQPYLMEAASQAMVEKIFDEIGLCPATARPRDPMLIGRIKQRERGWAEPPSMSFLIAWYVDLKTL